MDYISNTFEVLGLAIQFDRVINREVKFSSVFDWKINQSKFIAMPCWNGKYDGNFHGCNCLVKTWTELKCMD